MIAPSTNRPPITPPTIVPMFVLCSLAVDVRVGKAAVSVLAGGLSMEKVVNTDLRVVTVALPVVVVTCAPVAVVGRDTEDNVTPTRPQM